MTNLTTKIQASMANEGYAKVASLTLIGRGAAFTFHKVEDNFVFILESGHDHESVFAKGTEITPIIDTKEEPAA